MRLFVAIPADPETQRAAAAVVGALAPHAPDHRWSAPSDLHLTLWFVGETPAAGLPGVVDRVRSAAARTAPFEIRFANVGAFDSVDDPRVPWLGVDRGEPDLAALAAALGRDEPRPYRAHLTLGFRRGDRPSPSLSAAIRAARFAPVAQPVTELVLFETLPRGAKPQFARHLAVRLGA